MLDQRARGGVRLQLAHHVRRLVAELEGERADGGALRAGLQQIYRGKILAEAVDAGETLPTPTTRDTAARGMTRESADVNTSPRTNRP